MRFIYTAFIALFYEETPEVFKKSHGQTNF